MPEFLQPNPLNEEHRMTLRSTYRRLQAYDQNRNSFAGEHWLVLGLGVLLLIYGTQRRAPIARSLTTAAGSALIARAASGRDGLSRLQPTGG
jgi:uncharacterized membrane protein